MRHITPTRFNTIVSYNPENKFHFNRHHQNLDEKHEKIFYLLEKLNPKILDRICMLTGISWIILALILLVVLIICILKRTVTTGYMCNPKNHCTSSSYYWDGSICGKKMSQFLFKSSRYFWFLRLALKKKYGSNCSFSYECDDGLSLTCSLGFCYCSTGNVLINKACYASLYYLRVYFSKKCYLI